MYLPMLYSADAGIENSGDADADLIVRVQTGDNEAFGQIIEHHYRFVYKFIYALVGERGYAEENSFKSAVRLDSKNAVAHYNLGCVYIRSQQFKEAAESLERALSMQPGEVETCFNLAYAYSRQAKPQSAISQIRQCLVLRPDDAEMHFFPGNLYLAVKDKSSAITQYKTLYQLNPQLAQNLFSTIFKDKIIVVSPY